MNMIQRTSITFRGRLALAGVATVAITGFGFAPSLFAVSTTSTPTASGDVTAKGTRLATIISKGDSEINRRLASLATLSDKISSATKLTSSDKATLTTEVATTTSGLTTLKTKLDADATAAVALVDAQSIYTEYRVYALVLPKVALVKTADDQQGAEAKLSALADTLQTRVAQATTKGKDVSAEQAKLTDMKSQLANSIQLSNGVETTVLGLQPSDYNTDHALLSGKNTQLKQAHADDQAAVADAKAIIDGLMALR